MNTPPQALSMWQPATLKRIVRAIVGRATSSVLFCAVALLVCLSSPLRVNAAVSKQDLFYIVIDRSGSMGPGQNNLVSPAKTKLREFVAGLPQSTAVRIVFFSSEVGKTGRWDTLTADAKDSIKLWIQTEFQPSGETRLFDTVGTVLKEVLREKDNFGRIGVLVFSDGEDNKSTQFKDWAALEALSRELKVEHPAAFMRFFSLGSTPPKPPGEPWVTETARDSRELEKLTFEPKPEALFKINPELAEVGQPVNFVVRQGPGRITEVLWEFGDGSSAATDDVDHVYKTVGVFNGSLVVKGPGGDDKRPFSVKVNPPEPPDFVWDPATPQEQSDVHFFDRTRWSPESYHWSATGGATIVGADKKDCVVRFPASGEFTVVLECLRRGQLSRCEKRVAVVRRPPNPGFEVSSANPAEGQEVKLQAADVREGILHRWFAGENVIGEGLEFVWKAAGDGPVVLRHEATAAFGKDEASKTLTVEVPTPSAEFDITPGLNVPWNSEVHVAALRNQAGWRHEWLFDGRPLSEFTGSVASFRVTKSGPIEIIHIVTAKRSARASRSIVVGEPPPLPAEFKPTGRQLEIGQTTTLEPISINTGWTHEWLVDGTVAGKESKFVLQPVRPDKIGPLVVEHRVTSAESKGTHSETFIVVPPPLDVEIVFELSGRYAPCSVNFTAKTKGQIASYVWDFGDGSKPSNEAAPRHQYEKAGQYQVKLSVKDALNRPRDAKPVVIALKPWWTLWAVLAGVLLAAGGVVGFIIWRSKQLLPLACRLLWNYAGKHSHKDADSRELSIDELNIPGWKPAKHYTLIRRRATGYEILCDAQHHQQVVVDQPFTIENVEFRIES